VSEHAGGRGSALERRLRAAIDPVGRHPLLDEGATAAPVPAAVLFPLILDLPQPEVLLTVRHGGLRSHPGQISFPGGRCDAADPDVAATALRETWEEVGVERAAVRILGALPPYLTGTGYSVVPVLGAVPANYPYRLATAEVEEVFHVPLAYLLDAGNRQFREYEVNGERRGYFEFWFGRHRIWGATAQMIVNLHERLGSGFPGA
jgi:8-oxo-dGTP pyrophosphatase MutT (NUDIX family)